MIALPELQLYEILEDCKWLMQSIRIICAADMILMLLLDDRECIPGMV